ncbi:uncharacterized protein LOC109789498 isoform X2 [Cajanus cajan]|uniref:uncharacterized protein LOC109789498 isoform X2 n=1 Tax=Cajanus cajan TaxID=3821 RepID=UPI00098DB269|nr:uncharacterized protein LOC109789498 isoform X2 [Cajanus cajan]
MDTISSSRKRNHSYGTFTRSRSQLFLHRNRSGQLRFDPVPTHDDTCAELVGLRRAATSCKKLKRDDGDIPRPLTKDLRARRVYSPPQSRHHDDSDCTDRKKMSADATETSDLGLSCEAPGFDRGNGESLEESRDLQDRRGKNGGDCSGKIDGLDGTTLPDAEICGGSKVNEDERKHEAEALVKDTPHTDSKKNDSAFKSKSVLRPRFQGKLYKAPGSVNYGRLFPFLMDTVGGDSGTRTSQLGFCLKDEENGGEFRPLSSPSEEASKAELKTDGCTMPGTNGSKLISPHCLHESDMLLDSKEVATECLSVSPVEDKCLSESKVDAAADYGDKNVGCDLHDDDFKQLSKASSNHSACALLEFGVLNEECILTTPPDADIHDNSKGIVEQLESISHDDRHVKPMDSTRSTQENAGEGFCQKTYRGKDSLSNKPVPRQHLHRKLFKTPGSVSYKRLLPFLMDLTKDDTGTSKFDHQTHRQKDEADIHAKRFQLPLSSQRKEASIDEHKTDSSPMHGTVEFNSLENYVLANPSNELSPGNQSKSTTLQDLPELPMQVDPKEMVREGLSAPSVNEHIEKLVIGSKDERSSVSELNPSSVTVDDFHSTKNVAQNDDFKEVQDMISTQHNSESPPKDQNMHNINGDDSDLIFERHSSKEKGYTVDHDESKQFVNPEERECVSRCPPKGQSLRQLDTNSIDAEENETSSHAIIRNDNCVVLKHGRVSNNVLRSPSEKIVSEKSDMAGHSGDKALSVLKGINGCQTENGSESKITSVLKRCPRIRLFKQAGSLNYKRLLPFLLNTVENDSLNDRYPKLRKSMDQTRLQPISTSNLRLTSLSDSNGCVPMEHCAGNSGTPQQTGLHACDFNNDRSSSKSQIPECQLSRDSCKVIQLQDEKMILNGLCKLEKGPTPALSNSSVFSEVKENSPFLISCNEKSPERHDCCQSLSQLKVVEQLGVPAVGFKKGILKRNPRGCRGICTCLNCVSFRLHAERAFEFSRNQLLDAEEVAHDLMKELSILRSMLETSADSVNDNPVFDGSQVKEACRKAFAAEELAKDRFSQMNDDLNIHCRITSLQPPRVTFAVHVEEKVIPPDG